MRALLLALLLVVPAAALAGCSDDGDSMQMPTRSGTQASSSSSAASTQTFTTGNAQAGGIPDGYPEDYSPEGYTFASGFQAMSDADAAEFTEGELTSNPGYIPMEGEGISEDPSAPTPEKAYVTLMVKPGEASHVTVIVFLMASGADAAAMDRTSDKCSDEGSEDRLLQDGRVFVGLVSSGDQPEEEAYIGQLADLILERTGATDEC